MDSSLLCWGIRERNGERLRWSEMVPHARFVKQNHPPAVCANQDVFLTTRSDRTWTHRVDRQAHLVFFHIAPLRLASEAKAEVWIRCVINALVEGSKSNSSFTWQHLFIEFCKKPDYAIDICMLSTDTREVFFLFFVRGNIGPSWWSDV